MSLYHWSDDELTLLAAIHAQPRNDALRLAYADWLEKTGKRECAEFIRLQCQEPYIGVVYHPPTSPRISSQGDRAYDDPAWIRRLKELLILAPFAYRVGLPQEFWEELFCGLPLLADEWYGKPPDDGGKWMLDRIGPVARLDLFLHTNHLADWLAHPLMARVDILHLWPDLPADTEPDEDCTMNSHHDAYWAENIPVLAASPVIDRLYELHPCGCRSCGVLTSESVQNIARCRELLEPRVYVEYSY